MLVRDFGRMPGSTESPVRVAFVSSHAQLGGSEGYLELLLERIDPRWVAGVVVLQNGPFVERLRARGLEVDVVTTPARAGMLPAALRVRRVLSAQRPGLIHANGVKAALLTAVASVGTGVPVLWLKHDGTLDGPLGRLIARRARRVVGVSASVVAAFGSRLESKIDVVPNGVPEPEVDRAAARRLVVDLHEGPSDAPVVLVVARLDPAKGQQDVIEIASGIRARWPEARFLFAGGEDRAHPGYGARLRGRVLALGLNDAVRFLGYRDDAVALIAGADVLVVPSQPGARGWHEGFGLVGVEALWVGTPVVGYADGALPEVLGDSALLVAVGDREKLSQSILAVLEDGELRADLIARGRQRARERYDVDDWVAALQRQYRTTASEGAPGASRVARAT